MQRGGTMREFKQPPKLPFECRRLRISAVSLGILVSLSACVTPTVTTAPTTCASLLPQTWKQGVAGAELPFGNVIADWVVFADAQTGKLDQANGRTVDAIGIVERCESRDAAAVRSATRPRFLGIKL
jgi:hypothetical protein